MTEEANSPEQPDTPEQPEAQTESKSKKKRGLKFWLLVGGGILLASCLCITALAGLGSSEDDGEGVAQATEAVVQEGETEIQEEADPETTSPPQATSTPSPSDTPEPTPTEEIGTVENPVPYGESVRASTGLLGLGAPVSVTVTDTLRGQAAWDEIYIANIFNEEAPEGFEWMLIKVRIENVGDSEDEADVGPSMFAMRSGGRITEYFDVAMDVCCLEEVDRPELDSTNLLGGGSNEGWIYFPVGVDDPNPLLRLGQDIYMSVTPPEE